MEIKLGKRVPCEVEHNWYPMQAPFVLVEKSQKQKDQYRSYVADKLDETWIEQVNQQGDIFKDKYLHPQCEYIRIVKKDGITTN